MHRREILGGGAALAGLGLIAAPARAADTPLRTAAREAFIYASPMVEVANTRARILGAGLKAGHMFPQAGLATPQPRVITTPNNDTVYATSFIDLSKGPAKLTVPPLSGRYASLALMDMVSDNFAVLGTRNTGQDGGTFTLIGPTAAGPADALRSPTPWVWALARVLVDSPADLPAAKAVLAGFKVEAAEGGAYAPGVARTAPWPAWFAAANALLLENPPPATDLGILRRMAPLGLGSPTFDPAKFTAAEGAQIAAGLEDGRALIRAPHLGVKAEGGWLRQGADTENFFQDYPYRARIALSALAALPPAEAMYMFALNPKGEGLFNGDGAWRLGLKAGQLPPVDAFWSLTMYEATPQGQFFLTANPIDRYAIGDRTPGLVHGADGALDIWIGRTDPGGARSANWLPAPSKGPYSMVLRAYLPRAEMLSGAYSPPAIRPA